MTSSKTSTSKSSTSKSTRSSTASKGVDPDKKAEKAAPLPSPLDLRDEPVRNVAGEPNEQLGGDRHMDRGRLTTPPPPAQPEIVHNKTRRNDSDALTGHAVEIVDAIKHDVLGELKGKHGIFERVDEYEKNGFPKQIIVSLHGATGFLLSLPYKAVRHLPQVVPARWSHARED